MSVFVVLLCYFKLEYLTMVLVFAKVVVFTSLPNRDCSCPLLSVCLYVCLSVSLSLHFNCLFRWTWVSQYQNVSNVSILDFIGAKDGGANRSCKMCRAPVKSSPPTNQHPVFLTGQMPFLSPNQQCQSTEGIVPFRLLNGYKECELIWV